MDHLMGEIVITQGDVLPQSSFLPCDGRLLQIADRRYQALFTLISTMYGGDGRTTFAVPDLRQHKLTQAGCRMQICYSGIYPQRP